jgi:hypothetical protein
MRPKPLTIAIGTFFIILCLIHWWKPRLVYNSDGSLREFGVGYSKKTVLPLWLIVIVTAILSYGGALYFFESR